MSIVNFGGLATGLDTESLVTALMGIERQPLEQITKKKSSLQTAQTTLSSISSKLAALKTAARALETTTGYSNFKATSTDTGVVATASGSAAAGSFDVTVTALAKASKHYSAAQSSSTADLNFTGPLTLQIGTGTAVDIAIDTTDSLTDIATKINASGQRATAAIVFDGTDYRLQVRGLDTGTANGVTLGGVGATSLGLDTPAARVQTAQDADLTIDGIRVKRPTNSVTGVIPGVTLALTKTTASATVSVDADAESAKTKLKTLVTAYNDVISAGQRAAGYGATKASSDELSGDSTLRNILGRLARTIGEPVSGATGRYQTLSSIGLKSTKDGTLQLDEAALDKAVAADPSAVSRLIVTDTNAGTTGAMTKIASLVDQLATNANAPLLKRIESLGSRMRRLDDDSDAQERRLTLVEQQMRDRFTQLESIVSKINAQGSALAGIATSNNS